MSNVFFERLKLVKEQGLLSAEKLLQIASVFLLWGKITESEYDELIAQDEPAADEMIQRAGE